MIIESNRNGHRAAYAAYFSALLDDSQIMFLSDTGKIDALRQTLGSKRLLLSTADDYLVFALCMSVLRVLLLRRTQLVTIRAEHTLDRGGAKAAVKWVLYRLLRDLPLVHIVSIMPHRIEPRLTRLTNASIYDPAFFELVESRGNARNPNNEDLPLGQLPAEVVFLGVLSETRNVRVFLDLFGAREGIVSKVYGRRAANLTDDALANPGHVIVNEGHLDDSSFARILATAQSVWCAFTPDYDNFSGVFCNAARFGTPVWLTEGSRLCRFAQHHGGQEVYRLQVNGLAFVLFKRIELDLAQFKAENEATLK